MDVAVALIKKDGNVLMVFDEQWGAFTLPMTKRRVWKDSAGAAVGVEEWADAAGRAAVEVLGRSCLIEPVDFPDNILRTRSWRDGRVKDYHYRLFQAIVDDPTPLPKVTTEWLKPAQVTEPRRHPVSETAFVLIEMLRECFPKVLA
jgi:hypothetical protein